MIAWQAWSIISFYSFSSCTWLWCINESKPRWLKLHFVTSLSLMIVTIVVVVYDCDHCSRRLKDVLLIFLI